MVRAVPLMLACACTHGPDQARVGAQAPRFSLSTLNREWSQTETVDLDEAIAAHGAVLLSFGASYCGPCMLEWPMLRDLAEAYRARGLLVVFVSVDRDPEGVDAMRLIATQQLGISSPLIADEDGDLSRRYQVNALPQLDLIDPGGTVVWRQVGYRLSTIDELAAHLDRLLDDP